MFRLLKGFYEYYTQIPTFKILIIGLENSGKTVISSFFLLNDL